MRSIGKMSVVTALLVAVNVSQANAETFQLGRSNSNVSIQTIVEFGNNLQPVVINENSQINIARVIQIGGTGPVDATIVQTGTRNIVSVFQMGGSTNSLIAQSGVSNSASVMQIGGATNSLMLQIGDMNSGSVRQFGRLTWSTIFQFVR
jgi:minor curlin subunit